MTCIDPPPLTPDHLSAALDGRADAAVTKHLARCPHCSERLEAARALEQRLGGQLHRWDCPTPQRLADYQLGLHDETTAALRAHVTGCARCQADLAELQAFLADEPQAAPATATPRPAPARRPAWQELIAQLLPRTPALALRGEREGPLVAQAGEITLVLDVQPAGDRGLALVGQLAAPDQDQWTGALAQVLTEGRVTQTAIVDDVGEFRFASLPSTTLELRLTPPVGPAIVLAALDLGGKASAR
jgi:hypothetical protein